MKRKLLLIGSDNVHVKNYCDLIKSYFTEIKIISNGISKVDADITEVVKFSLRNPLLLYKSIQSVKKIAEMFQPDIIHIHQANVIAYIAIKATGHLNKKIVLTVWGSDVLVMPHKNFLFKKMLQYNLRNADYITASAHYLAISAQQLALFKHPAVEANFGIDIILGKMTKEKIIYSNRLHKKLYNLDVIIREFKLFLKNHTEWKLIIAGDGEETNNLKKLVMDLQLTNSVEFTGWLNNEDNIKWYKKSTIYVSIPSSDSKAISLMESMAYGCIPVVSNLPASKELIEDGKNGIIMNATNKSMFERALQMDSEKVSSINQEIILRDCTKEVNRIKFTNLYTEVLNAKN